MMGHCTNRLRIVDFVGMGMGFGAILIAAGAVFGDRDSREVKTIGEIHRITVPVVEMNGPPGCAAEAAAYAAALLALEAAQSVADDKYLAWYRCEHNGADPPPPPPAPETPDDEGEPMFSILEQ
mgnify:CR=1 FL=1